MSDGATLEEAHVNVREAMEGWIETKLEAGLPVPEPLNTDQYSGKFVVRLPKTLHRRLAVEAEKEGVSLNQYTLYKLSM
jgi:predicted HicB family RNase H-like nuclease